MSLLAPIWGLYGDLKAQQLYSTTIVTTENYGTMQKHSSYTVKLKNKSIGKMISIITLEGNVSVFMIKLFNSENSMNASQTVGHLELQSSSIEID